MKIINIGILAHVDAGKTTLTESLLYASGAISEPGSVEKGTTRTDTMFLERQRGITIQAAVTSFQWHRCKVNIVDTPGHMDFPKDMKELRYITRRDAFVYPVCFDEKDDFNRLNHFPDEMTFQTFLLDKDNRVAAIGNPVHNPKVKELYLKVLTGGEVVKAETPITKVSLDVTSIDFGSFPQSEKQERKFTLTNTGQHVLVIYDVITSCGCTKVNYNKEGVRPGEKAELTVIYEAEKAEHFSKTVTIYCNADNSPLRLKVTGNAE